MASEDNIDSEDLLHYIESLLMHFDRFPWLEDKSEIEKTCCIRSEHLWSPDEIKRACEERDKITDEPKRKQWSCVIAFQVMERLCHDEAKTDKSKHEMLSSALWPITGCDIISSTTIGLKIPLSELFGWEATSERVECVQSEYKLIDGCPSTNKTGLRKKKTYVLSYNENTKNAEWVYEILSKQSLAEKKNISGQVANKFKKIEGYDRGHLAAVANHRWCQEAYYDTNMFSNLSPQLSTLNQKYWASLEQMCRDEVKEKDSKVQNIHLYTGPIFLDKDSVSVDQKVPDYFFKVIFEENENGTVSTPKCYLIPNDKLTSTNIPKNENIKDFLKRHLVDIERIESLTKLNFCVQDIQKYRDEISSETWTGEDGEGKSRNIDIKVRITIPL